MAVSGRKTDAVIKKKVKRKGTLVVSHALLASILVLASAIVIFLIVRTVMCKAGVWLTACK